MFQKSRKKTLKLKKNIGRTKGNPLEVFSCFEKGIYSVMLELSVAVHCFSALFDNAIATAY